MTDEPLVRRLTVFGIWLLAVNGMIGAGIFGVGAEAARLAGNFSPWMFLLCGALMLPVIASFGEAARHFDGTGGPLLYAETAFGKFVGFQTGWTFYVARATAFAANINLLISAIAFFWIGADEGATRATLLILICAGLTWVNVVGTGQAIRTVGVLTALKFAPLFALIVFGLPAITTEVFVAPAAQLPPAADFGAALVLLVYAYVGFESAVVPAGETRNPSRDMPRALMATLLVVSIVYFFIQAVSVSVLPNLAQSERPLVEAGSVLLGGAGAMLITAGVIASVGGNVAGAMFSTPRMTYALARDGQLPSLFGWVHPRYRTPAASVLIFGGLVLVLALTGSFVWLASISVLTRLLMYLVCIGAIPALRRGAGQIKPLPAAPATGYLMPVLAAVVCIGLVTQVSYNAVVVAAIFIAAGTVLYLINHLVRR